MEVKDIIKLDTYAGINISVKGCIDLMLWSHFESEKAKIYEELANAEYKIFKIIQNQMKERHKSIAEGLLSESEDATHLSELLDALVNKWIERLDKNIKS